MDRDLLRFAAADGGVAALFLKETVGFYRWSAVLVGLVGIVVVTLPKLTLFGDGFDRVEGLGIVAALGAAAVAAVAMIQIRRLVRTEKTATIVIYFTLTSSGIALFSLPFGWVVPSAGAGGVPDCRRAVRRVGQLLLTACYRYADASTIAPLEYTSLLLAVTIGFVLFGEVATVTTLVGGLIVVGAGVFIVMRERRLGIQRRKARRVASPPG